MTITEREAWRRLREDADREEPIYDTSRILIDADNLGLTWLDLEGEARPYRRSSFAVRLSRLKNKAKEHLAALEEAK